MTNVWQYARRRFSRLPCRRRRRIAKWFIIQTVLRRTDSIVEMAASLWPARYQRSETRRLDRIDRSGHENAP